MKVLRFRDRSFLACVTCMNLWVYDIAILVNFSNMMGTRIITDGPIAYYIFNLRTCFRFAIRGGGVRDLLLRYICQGKMSSNMGTRSHLQYIISIRDTSHKLLLSVATSGHRVVISVKCIFGSLARKDVDCFLASVRPFLRVSKTKLNHGDSIILNKRAFIFPSLITKNEFGAYINGRSNRIREIFQ